MQMSVTSNALQVAHDLAAVSTRVHLTMVAVTERNARLFATKVQARASGRPGPRVQTGDYRRSIGVQFRGAGAGTIRWEIGTNSPQGRRLEFGFWGMVDSLGRLYHQPPYPHFGPTADEMERQFPVSVQAAVAADLAEFGT